jgi:hypothetical protein
MSSISRFFLCIWKFLLIWVDHITVGDRSWHSIDDAKVVLGALVAVMAAPITICALILVISGESTDKKAYKWAPH